MTDKEYAYRLDLIGKANAIGATIDGQKAVIGGARNPYGYVRLMNGKGGDVEYSWAAIARVLDNGGAFNS
jgi:hypothetical protein